jgi:hypothetical protein
MKTETPPAEPVEFCESDIVDLAHFVASQSEREPASIEKHLRWLLLENPARDPQLPLGCGLRSALGKIVGCILYVPQFFRFQQQRVPVVWSSCFYVDKRYRKKGGLVIFFRFAKLGSKWPLCANSANALAAKFWQVHRATPIPFSDHELFGVINWGPILEEVLYRKAGRRGPWNLVGNLVSPFAAIFARLRLACDGSESLSRLTSVNNAVALPIHQGTPELTAARDLPYLRWRYFSGRDSTLAVFAFRGRGVENPILVTVNQRRRGYRQQINTLNLLDIYPVVTPDVCVSIVGALMQKYRESVDAIVLRGLDERGQQVFCDLGFKRRQFDAPNGWMLDRSNRLPTRNWHFVPADGDWLI